MPFDFRRNDHSADRSVGVTPIGAIVMSDALLEEKADVSLLLCE